MVGVGWGVGWGTRSVSPLHWCVVIVRFCFFVCIVVDLGILLLLQLLCFILFLFWLSVCFLF